MDYRDPTVKTWRLALHAIVTIGLGIMFLACMVADRYDMALVLALLFVGDQITDAVETRGGDIVRAIYANARRSPERTGSAVSDAIRRAGR